MTDLKPCPFCGGEATIKKVSSETIAPFFVAVCRQDSCLLGEYQKDYSSDDEASKAWNTRPGEDAARLEVARQKAENEAMARELALWRTA